MWNVVFDPVFQGFALIAVLGFLGYVAYDLYDDAREPSAPLGAARRRAGPRARATARPETQSEAPRDAYVEPSVEIWTDSQGEMQGRVRRGPCRGMRLDEMDREQCEAQNAYCRQHDYPAATALEAYIRQRFSSQRRNTTRLDGEMSRTDALSVLGLREGASDAEIHSAYRTMIKKHHPDHGGSHAKAARINQAKDLLVG